MVAGSFPRTAVIPNERYTTMNKKSLLLAVVLLAAPLFAQAADTGEPG